MLLTVSSSLWYKRTTNLSAAAAYELYFLLQIVHSMESSSLREIAQISDIEETITGSLRLRALKARFLKYSICELSFIQSVSLFFSVLTFYVLFLLISVTRKNQ
jgi:hypothetical protein